MLEELRADLRAARERAREDGAAASQLDVAVLAGFKAQTSIQRFETSGTEITNRLPGILAAYAVVTGQPLGELAERAIAEFGEWLSDHVDQLGPKVKRMHEDRADLREFGESSGP